MSPTEKDLPASLLGSGLVRRMAVPGIDLPALALAAIAASLFFAWHVAASWSTPHHAGSSVIAIAVDQMQAVAFLLLMSFGHVFVALGGALFRQRKAPQFLSFSFMTTSLAIVGLLVALGAAMQGVEMLVAVQDPPPPETTLLARQYLLVVLVLNSTSQIAVVAVAARLYVQWRRTPAAPQDSLRFAALTLIALIVAIGCVPRWAMNNSSDLFGGAMSAFEAVLGWILLLSSYIIWSAGAVFLHGYVGIANVRRAQVEDRLGWVMMAAIAASLAHWPVVYGPSVSHAMPALANPVARWTQPYLRTLLSSLAMGIVSGPIYLYVVNRDALREALAKFPTSVAALRRWPYRPIDDE